MAANWPAANGRRDRLKVESSRFKVGEVQGGQSPMYRFTIRRLALITAIVATGMGRCVDRGRSAARHAAVLDKSNARAAVLLRTLDEHDIVVEELSGGYVAYPRPKGQPTVMDRYTP